MLAAALAALDYAQGDREAFHEDKMRRDAILRNLEILGEAAKRVSSATKLAHPHVPRRAIAGMRDKLIHDYGNVDADLVWRIIEDRLPGLVASLRAMTSA